MDANINDPVASTDPRQDDYDIWLGTVMLDKWIPWSRHGTSNVLYLDGHAKSVEKPDGYLGMYPGGSNSHQSELVSLNPVTTHWRAWFVPWHSETSLFRSPARSSSSKNESDFLDAQTAAGDRDSRWISRRLREARG